MIRTFYLFLSVTLLLSQRTLFAQVGIGGQPHPSAVLDLKSPANDKAFYPPRLTSAQRQAIASPQVGALVYDLDKGALLLFDGQNWLPLLTTDLSQASPVTRTADDGAAGDNFGIKVTIAGDYAVVGAYNKTIGSNANQGAAYVFVRSGNTWSQMQRLTASDGVANTHFGSSVAVSGDYIIVGAKEAAYVFVRNGNTWIQQQRLTANDGTSGDNFGTSVAISGDYIIVGANFKTIGGNTSQGTAYVFVRGGSTWTQQQRLTASDGASSDFFGSNVALGGDYAIVGAYNKNATQGAAYLFVRNGDTWSQPQRLMPNDGASYDNFGISLAISGDYAIVGTKTKTIGGNLYQGAAYVFMNVGTSWLLQQRLTASDGAANDGFGTNVAIAGDYVIVGANNKTIGNNSGQGAAYIFMRSGNTWTQQQRVTDNSPVNTLNGSAVGLSNGTFIIGGPGFQSFRGKVGFGTVN
ncbi:FG-GAP repeat protein [Spirosoma koreense]